MAISQRVVQEHPDDRPKRSNPEDQHGFGVGANVGVYAGLHLESTCLEQQLSLGDLSHFGGQSDGGMHPQRT